MDKFSTITNLAFLVAGISIFPDSWQVGTAAIGLSVTSAMYHWTKDRFWRHADVISIYFVFLLLIDYLTGGYWWPLALVFGGLLAIYHTDIRSHLVIGVLAGITLMTLILNAHWIQVFAVVSCFAVWGGLNVIWLNRDELDWPYWVVDLSHSVTHVFAALGIYLMI